MKIRSLSKFSFPINIGHGNVYLTAEFEAERDVNEPYMEEAQKEIDKLTRQAALINVHEQRKLLEKLSPEFFKK